MTATRERTLAGAAVGATILAWFGLLLTVGYVPRLAQLWAELGTPLSSAQRLLLGVCNHASRSLIAIAPTLLAATAAAVWWRLETGRRARAGAREP